MTSRVRAAVGSAAFFAVAPGVVAGVVPWLLTRWHAHAWWLPLRVAGALLIVGGVPLLARAFVHFVVDGLGTPAPIAPPSRLVVEGVYRYVRNPMYIALEAAIVGQALLLGRPVLFTWAAVVGLAVWSFARWYEEPALRRQFGAEYEVYRRAVPAWVPRFRRRAARGER